MISDSSSVLVGTEKGTIFLYNVNKNEFLFQWFFFKIYLPKI